MHFHLPQPTHGWREFVGEVGIIVLGVLIALGFEQLVQEIQWSDAVRKAHANIGTETELANYFFGFRTAASPCVERRLVSINDVIENVASHKPVGRLESIGPDIGAGLSDSNWQAERAAQTLTHFDKRELDQLGGYYHPLDSVADAVFREDAEIIGEIVDPVAHHASAPFRLSTVIRRSWSRVRKVPMQDLS
jgi:hypothetical protein